MSIPYLTGQISIFFITPNIFNNKNCDSLSVNSQNINSEKRIGYGDQQRMLLFEASRRACASSWDVHFVIQYSRSTVNGTI